MRGEQSLRFLLSRCSVKQRIVETGLLTVVVVAVFPYSMDRESQLVPVTRREYSDLPPYFFVLGKSPDQNDFTLVAVLDFSTRLWEDLGRTNSRATVQARLHEGWPGAAVLWGTDDPKTHNFYIRPESAFEIATGVNRRLIDADPNDIAFAKRGFRLRVLEHAADGSSEKILLELHRGNFPEVYLYKVISGDPIPLGYRLRTRGIVVVSAFNGFVAALLCFPLVYVGQKLVSAFHAR